MKSKKGSSNPPLFREAASNQSLHSSHLIINACVKAQYLDLFRHQREK